MSRDPESSPAAFLGAELRRVRLAAGIRSQEQLADILHTDRTVITKIENGDRPPTPEMADAIDELFHLDGLISRLAKLARKAGAGFAPSFGEWIDSEREATVLRWWENQVVPGLLQTADYARVILATNPDFSDPNILEERLAGRIDRQAVLDRNRPPELYVLIDEGVLHRRVGSAKIMHDQLVALADMSCRPNITVQVVRAELGAHAGLLGAFTLATLQGKPGIVYLETSADGQITEKSSVVAHVTLRFDRLRGEAVPRGESRDLILKIAEEQWQTT